MTDAVRRRQPSPKSGFMYYYDPNNRNPRRWATVATAVYALLLIVMMVFRPGGLLGKYEFSLTRAVKNAPANVGRVKAFFHGKGKRKGGAD